MTASAILAPPLTAAALLLAVAGVGKIRRPRPTAQALATADLPHRDQLVRTLGVLELIAGAGAAATTFWPFRVAVAVCYLVFAAFLSYVLARGIRLDSCGCAGSQDIPPTRFHVVLDGIAVLVAVASVTSATPSLPRVLAGLKLYAAPYIAGTFALAYLLYVAAAFLPRVVHAHEHVEPTQPV